MKTEQPLNLYPNSEKFYTRSQIALNNAPLVEVDKQLIHSFQEYLFSMMCGKYRVTKLTTQLRNLCMWNIHLNPSRAFSDLTRIELQKIVSYVNTRDDYSEATKADYRRAIKQFYKWYKEEDPRQHSKDDALRASAQKAYHYIEREVRSTYKERQADPSTIITEEECQQVIDDGCKTLKEKAFVALLHESGCRSGEILNLRVSDVHVKDNWAEVHIRYGKTGKRVIFVIKSLPHLLRYLELHPLKHETNPYLWIGESTTTREKPLLHRGAQKLLNRTFSKAKITKRHNLHWFRHSRATLLAPKMTESMLCKYLGWKLGSRQVKTYIHLCNDQLESVFLKINGIKNEKESAEPCVKCICGTLNVPSERYCFKCTKPLHVETIIQDQELMNSEINKTIQFMMEIAKNPEMIKRFEEFKVHLGNKHEEVRL